MLENKIIEVSGKVEKFEEKSYSTYVYLEKAQYNNQYLKHIIIKIDNEKIDEYGLKIGNKINVSGTVCEFKKLRNLGNFDEGKYYHSLGVSMIVKAGEITVVNRHYNFFKQILFELKCRIVDGFKQSINSDKAGIFSAIVMGDKSELVEEDKQLYQDSGIAHILAISGLHISLIGMGIYGLLRKKLKYFPAAVISIVCMLSFLIMTGSSVSALRATLMFVISIVAIGKGKKYDILSALALSAIFTLIFNPYIVTNIGFLMSYSAIISIGIITKNTENFISPSHKFSKSFIASFSITFFSIPLVASTYYQIPLYSILLNLIVIPFMSFVLGSGIISGFVGLLSITAGRFFIGIGIYIIYFIEGCSSVFLNLPISIITTGKPKTIVIILYYLILGLFIAICLWFHNIKRKVGLNAYVTKLVKKIESSKTNKRYSKYGCRLRLAISKYLKFKFIRVILSALIAIILVLIIIPTSHRNNLRITVFDVDQGDGILIQNTNGNVYLIDGGSTGVKEVYKYRLKSGIKYFGIDTIDYVIITHPDTDHISGIIEMMEDNSSGRIEIKNILIPYIPEDENYENLKVIAKETDINFINIYTGMVITDDDLILRCLHPSVDYYSSSVNGYSTVIDLSFGDFNGLFTGDLEADGEKILINSGLFDTGITYELLKVSHHGSRTSSTESFLNKVMPETAVISAGVNNSYGHPSKETLERLNKIGTEYNVTSECGEIIIEAELNGEYNTWTVIE